MMKGQSSKKNLQRVEMALKIKRAEKAKKIYLTEEGLKRVDRAIGIRK